MINGYPEIIKSLYERYFRSFDRHSQVTSSYWRTIGRQHARWTDAGLELDGYGFGDFKKASLLHALRFVPRTVMVKHLMRQYPHDARLDNLGRTLAKKSGRLFDFDCAKQVLMIDHILKSIKTFEGAEESAGQFACVIGDGYGYMTSLLKSAFPKLSVICVNLGRTLLFDAYYCRKILPEAQAVLLEEISDRPAGDAPKIIFIEAENCSLLERLPITLTINTASMQEMSAPVIRKYFDLMRSSPVKEKYFYCCNREEKILPDGEIVRFNDYPWRPSDSILTDELCPWNQKYPASLPPFWRPFDGPIRHRLVRWASAAP